MIQDPYLPVSHHVAIREAGRSLRHAEAAADTWVTLTSQFIGPARERFVNRERLTSEIHSGVVAAARKTLLDLDPVAMEEDSRQPTRTRPKGEQHEIRAVTRMGVDAARTKLYGLSSVRLYLNRKRVDFEYDMLGLDVTGHLLERTMQRDLASWTGRFREVDAALNDAAGMAVIWRYAFASGALATTRVAVPLGDGLMLGNLTPSRVDVISRRVEINRNGVFMTDMGRSPFHVPPYADAPDMRYLRAAFATAVGDDLMTIPQVDLRDTLRRFREGNTATLDALGRSATWRTSALADIAGFDDLYPEVKRLAGELAGILSRTDLDRALNHGHGEHEARWGSVVEGPSMRP